MDINEKNAFLVLKKYLKDSNKDKFEHSIRVANISKILATKWGASVSDAIIVALLHDIGKSINKQGMLSLCIKHKLPIHEFEIFENINALHGKVSSLLFEHHFNIHSDNKKDIKEHLKRFNAISHAISTHVTGTKNMGILDQIIFIADNIEPKKRNHYLLDKILSDEIDTPNECIKLIIEDKIKNAHQKSRELDPLLKCTLESIEER